ncbi:MAG: nitrogenase iron-molybdenum cofactor biosynthesis protein NifE [Deltaproteobacteria bacterium]|nr:nitrogenase iron-molybdenum cofactor biosynthesis protein NifE [Deltaproteobacteria bacterium]
MQTLRVLNERRDQVQQKGTSSDAIACDRKSAAGSVSQRACVFCGSRVVLYPIADALHVVHGPVGCAAYTWDIRGALSSGPELHRNSFSTDLRERDIVFGGEKKLERALLALIEAQKPKAVFVYSTCIVGVIGDDIDAVCRRVAKTTGLPVLPVHSEGFRGTKKDGYRAACDALFALIALGRSSSPVLDARAECKAESKVESKAEAEADGAPRVDMKPTVNLLGEFNIAGETWMIRSYYERMGVDVVACMTGDGRVDDIRRAHEAKLNLVQCSGSMTPLAKRLESEFSIPFRRVSYFGLEDTAAALYATADFFGDRAMRARTEALVRDEVSRVMPELRAIRREFKGKRAAVYVGGAFKAMSLIKALTMIGIETVVVGSQTGNKDDYRVLKDLTSEGAVIVDDSNPIELSSLVQAMKVDLFIGGVKERPIAYKLGVGFCDHNHERKTALAGFEGMLNFAKEVRNSVLSPVWELRRRAFPGS